MMTGGGRVYGGSNMTVILPNETLHGSTDALEALLISSSSPSFHGSRSMVNFEEITGKKPARTYYQTHDQDETCDGDLDDCFHQPEKKRRLTVDQVQFLERSFEVENKLEPERKIQLAKDLGLQPRQVAIWFQNRRARWKTKQLEKDYEALKANYNRLKADYENLLKEREKNNAEQAILLTDDLLFKEKDLPTQRGNSETFEHRKQQSHLQSQKPDYNSVSSIKESDATTVICKQEDLSSANSAVFDSDSPHCTDGGHSSLIEPAVSSNIFEPDQSDLSHTEEEEEDNPSKNLSLVFNLPKLEDSIYEDPHGNSCNYGFVGEDQAFWFWPQ